MEKMLGVYKAFWERCFDFKDRTSRLRFWLILWANMIIYLLIIGYTFAHKHQYGAVFGIFVFVLFTLGMILPTLAMFARRYNDLGLSRYWLIITVALPIGLIIAELISGSLVCKVLAAIIIIAGLVIVMLPKNAFDR